MLGENTNYFTDYESYTVTPSGTDGSVTFVTNCWKVKITNDGPDTIVVSLGKEVNYSATSNISLPASSVFEEPIFTNSVHYALASGSTNASLRIVGLR